MPVSFRSIANSSSENTPASPETPRRMASLWKWRLVLSSPFVLCLLALFITGGRFRVFWEEDEAGYHWPQILWFAARLPGFDPDYPNSATTPLFHLICASLVKWLGLDVRAMRTFVVPVAMIGVLALFEMLHGTLRRAPATAALLSAVFLISCYFFGYSFRVLTDVPALVACILAMAQLFAFADPRESSPLKRFLWGGFWCGVAVLTRQSYIFLYLPFVVMLLGSTQPNGRKLLGLGGLLLAALPTAALMLAWHGLVPPAKQVRHTSSLVHLYPMALPILLLGFYTPFFWGSAMWKQIRCKKVDTRLIVPAAIVATLALGVVALFPLVPPADTEQATYFPTISRHQVAGYFNGWLYAVAGHLPKIFANSILFWLLLPIGAGAATWFITEGVVAPRDPWRRVSAVFLLSLLLSSTLNIVSAQKYYDGLILLFLIWHSPRDAARDPWQRASMVALMLLFCCYHASFYL